MKPYLSGDDSKGKHVIFPRAVVVLIGIAVNVLLSYITDRFELPMFLDTAGTIAVAALCGYLPGIITAVVTNALCMLFNQHALYFAFINALIAVFTALFVRRYSLQKLKNLTFFVMITALFCGSVSALVQWGLFKEAQNAQIGEAAATFAASTGLSRFPSFLIVNILINILDKGLTSAAATLALILVPQELAARINKGSLRQRPLSREELKNMREWSRNVRHSIRFRTARTLMGALLALVLIIGFIGARLFFDSMKNEKTEAAREATKFAASVIDPEMVPVYIEEGRDAPGYAETEEMFYKIRSTAKGVEYLYALKIGPEGCVFIFDLASEEGPEPFEPGDFVPIEEAFKPLLPMLLAGEEIEPVEDDDAWNWMRTVYYPVKDENGRCVCYVGADVSMDMLSESTALLMLKVLLILAGFFILILAYSLRATEIYTTYPVNSIALCVDGFVTAGSDQKKLDANVKRLRSLGIRTEDELEKLYHSICEMSLNQTEQLRAITHFSDATAKMQDGLIITMADMVENRDSDTGAHIQKTAAYVKIIADGLQKKGYYAEKVTNKYKSDVVRSAPLHDVGKINISDTILNKPGKLTDEEYEIMKTHTTIGKNILENAIGTVQGENYLKEARNMAAYHHERWDGKGYPEGLHGEVIPLSARIMAVADVFDALTSPRVYKPAFPLEKALSIIQEGAGTQFDPKCVEVFMESLSEVKAVLNKYGQEL